MESNHRIIRYVQLFDSQVVLRICLDKVEFLTIVVDLENIQVYTNMFDCILNVHRNNTNDVIVDLETLDIRTFYNLGVC